jgi:hypothetical protein
MKKITLFDIILTASLILLTAILVYFYFKNVKQGEPYLYIQGGKSEYYYSMKEDKTVEIKGELGVTKIKIEKGKFYFTESPCSNKECIKSGKVFIPGVSVVCLPNRVSAYVVNENKDDGFDGVAR